METAHHSQSAHGKSTYGKMSVSNKSGANQPQDAVHGDFGSNENDQVVELPDGVYQRKHTYPIPLKRSTATRVQPVNDKGGKSMEPIDATPGRASDVSYDTDCLNSNREGEVTCNPSFAIKT